MESRFNKVFWEDNLRYADFYIRLEKELTRIFVPAASGRGASHYRHMVYRVVGKMLRGSEIPLAVNGPNFDKGRMAIDMIVVHHTKGRPDIDNDILSGIGLLKQYAIEYLKNDVLGYNVYGKPVWSGHFQNGKQVFYAYHWLVRPDGRIERLLEDEYIGWHAGIWDINCRSIGVALAGNYDHSTPPGQALSAIKWLLEKYYPHVSQRNVMGHCEVMNSTKCPGRCFLSWKGEILR